MTWYVKGRNPDGAVVAVMCHTAKDVLENLQAHRDLGREAWIEDANGKLIDEKEFQ